MTVKMASGMLLWVADHDLSHGEADADWSQLPFPCQGRVFFAGFLRVLAVSELHLTQGVSVGGSTILLWNSKQAQLEQLMLTRTGPILQAAIQIMLYDIDVTMQASVPWQVSRRFRV